MSKLILALIIIGGLIRFIIPIRKRLLLVRKAPGKLETTNITTRMWSVIKEVCFQSKVIKHRPIPGLMHAFVFWGFVAFIIVTLNHFVSGFGGTLLGTMTVYNVITAIVAFFAVMVIIGILYLAIRRFVFQPEALGEHLSWSSGSVALFILILMVTYLLDYFHVFADKSLQASLNWWVHSVVIIAFLMLIPQSKHLHLVIGPFTVFLKDPELARIKPLDIENEEMGAEKLADLEKHSVLGAFTCVECGRCFDHCPARNTGKVLDPKQWMLDIRKGMLNDPQMEDPSQVLNFDMIWQCTTCGACTYQCPVGIDQVIPIIAFRRGFVSESKFPSPMRALFDNLERSGNPWKYQPHEAAEFIRENDIPIYEGQEVLYWMGCMGRFDAYYRKVSKAFSDLLKSANIDFGVLENEKCTGDAARRAGNELVFLELAEANVENLNNTKAKTIVTTCPHCLRTLREYHDFGLRENFAIVHYTTFIQRMIPQGRLQLKFNGNGKVVYHDPCYLSRYLAPQGYREPRELLRKTGAKLVEVKRSKDISFCCGAGGGQLFNEETEGTRINHDRVDKLLATGANIVATSCPFCQLMLRDGLSDKGREEVVVKDIIQLIQT